MNRTLTESRHVIHLIDKMKGQFAVDRSKLSKVEEVDARAEMKEYEKVNVSKDNDRILPKDERFRGPLVRK